MDNVHHESHNNSASCEFNTDYITNTAIWRKLNVVIMNEKIFWKVINLNSGSTVSVIQNSV